MKQLILVTIVSFLSLLFLNCGDVAINPEDLESSSQVSETSSNEDSSADPSSVANAKPGDSSDDTTNNNDDSSSNSSEESSELTSSNSSEEISSDVEASSSAKKLIDPQPVRIVCSPHEGSYPFTTEEDSGPIYSIYSDGELPEGSRSASITLNDNGMLNINPLLTDPKNQSQNRWATGETVECEEITNGKEGWLFDVSLMLLENETEAPGFFMVHNTSWGTTNLSSVKEMKFDIKTTQDFEIMVESTNLDKVTFVGATSLTGYSDGEWHSITIPVEDFGSEIQWEFTKIFFKAGGILEDGKIYMDNLRFTGFEKNSRPSISGDDEIAVSEVNGEASVILEYIELDEDPISWNILSEPAFGSVSISDNDDGEITVTYTNNDNSSVDAFIVEFDDGNKNYKRISFSVSIKGGAVKPIAIYADDAAGKYIPIMETGWWEGGGSQKESDREGVSGDQLWDGGAYNGGIFFDFTKSGFLDITEMESLTFDINFYDTTETQWGLDKMLIIASIEDSDAMTSTEWSRYAESWIPGEDIMLDDEWKSITIDLQHGQDSLSYTNDNGTFITANKAAIKTFSLAIYNGGGNFQLDNIVFNPKE
ncbi:MAG: hypothetical protein OCD76_09445 [Reichenbachiella sp.]